MAHKIYGQNVLVINNGSAEEITPAPTPEVITDYTVRVIDYDGTVLMSQTGKNGEAISLPEPPSHERLVFQGWSSTDPINEDNTVTIDNGSIDVGAMYTTASGLNEFDISLTKKISLTVTLKMDGTKNWGDGTSDTETTHTYTDYGNYMITCDGTTITSTRSSGLFGQNSSLSYLTSVRLATVNSIPNYSFQYCSNMKNITFGTCNEILDYALQYCRSLRTVVFPNILSKLGGRILYSCHGLINAIIPASISTIPVEMFHDDKLLDNLVLGKNITDIYGGAFYGCYNLSNITLPKTITSISNIAFNGTSLKNVYYSGNIASWCDIIGLEYLVDRPDIVLYIDNNKIEGELIIPDDVINIRSYAFNQMKLTKLKIGSNVSNIETRAFSTLNIKDIQVAKENNTYYVDGKCLIESSSKKIILGCNFSNIPNNVLSIGNYAFYKCSGLTNINIPDSVTSIGDSAFSQCAELTSITIGNNVTSIGNSSFSNCKKLASVNIPDSVTSIGKYAFSYCENLTKIKIPDQVISLGERAFEDCKYINTIEIGSGLLSIPSGAFTYGYHLKNIIINNNSITTIDNQAFYCANHLENINLPNSVEVITGSFQNCPALYSITLPYNLTTLDTNAFYNCGALTEVIFSGSNLQKINAYAFYQDYRVIKYDFSNQTSVPTLSNTNAFIGIGPLCKIVVPDALYDEWIAATNWSTYANYIYKASEVTE